MTDRPHLLAGRDAVVHWWACADRRVVERATKDATGAGRIELVCIGCGGSDGTEGGA